MWMTSGGHKVDVKWGGVNIQLMYSSLSVLSLGKTQMFIRSQLLRLTLRNWSLLLHMYLWSGTAPSMSTLCPHHVISVPRPSPFLPLFHLRVLYWTQIEEQKRGRMRLLVSCQADYNSKGLLCSCYQSVQWLWFKTPSHAGPKIVGSCVFQVCCLYPQV